MFLLEQPQQQPAYPYTITAEPRRIVKTRQELKFVSCKKLQHQYNRILAHLKRNRRTLAWNLRMLSPWPYSCLS